MKMKMIICFGVFVALVAGVYTESTANATDESLEDVMKLLENDETLKGNYDDSSPDMELARKELEEAVANGMKQLGLDQLETIDRESFRKLFTKVVLQEEQLPESEMVLFNKLIERVIAIAPESFPREDVNKYIDMQFISSQLNEIMSEEGFDPNQMGDEFGGEDIEDDSNPTPEDQHKITDL